MFMLDITVDREYELAYVVLGSGEFKQTLCINNSLNVDIDSSDQVIGVEFLSFNQLSYSVDGLLHDYPDLTKDVLESIVSAQEMLLARISLF